MTTDGAQVLDSPIQSPAELLRELTLQRTVNQQLTEQLDNASQKLTQMEHQLQQLLRRLYGRSSEKIDPRQMALFADLLKELEGKNPPAQEPPAAPASGPASPRNGHGRRRIPEDLPRERRIHDLPEDQKPCPCCGTQREVIGQEVSEQLDYEPARLKVIEHVRLKYLCKACEKKAAQGGPQIAIADKPLEAIEKCLAAPGLVSHVIVSRFCDHLPYYRLERICERLGIDLSRSTLSDWMRLAALALRPLYGVAAREVKESRVMHTDDTPVDVLDRKLPQTRQGRFWVYVGDAAHPLIVFDYTPSRSRDGPAKFLDGWGNQEKRFLQADAYGGYDGIFLKGLGTAGAGVVEVACWAHARRKFHEAQGSDRARSTQALAYIRLLYDVEAQAREQFQAQSPTAGGTTGSVAPSAQPRRSLADIRLELRQRHSLPRLTEFKRWLTAQQATAGGAVLPKSPMGQAITYALNQWDALAVYAADGRLSIDNNVSENALRRVAIGRKNWLFCGSDNGGTTAAILFSFIATCQRHGVEPFAYLKDVLTRIASHPHHRLAELLPDRWKPLQPPV